MRVWVRFGSALLSVFIASPTLAADFFVCERPNGIVHIADRSSVLPDDCASKTTTSLESRPTPKMADPTFDRSAEIDDVIQRARSRRAAEAAARERWLEDVRVATRSLVMIRMAVDETRSRLASERWRWTAFLPGQWIILFADEEQVERLEAREAFLVQEEDRILGALKALQARARQDNVPQAVARKALPDLRPRPEPADRSQAR